MRLLQRPSGGDGGCGLAAHLLDLPQSVCPHPQHPRPYRHVFWPLLCSKSANPIVAMDFKHLMPAPACDGPVDGRTSRLAAHLLDLPQSFRPHLQHTGSCRQAVTECSSLLLRCTSCSTSGSWEPSLLIGGKVPLVLSAIKASGLPCGRCVMAE